MSKLDEIMDSLEAGEAQVMGVPETKQQIKALFLDIIDDTMLYSGGMPDASINLEQIKKKVKEL